MPNLLMDIFKVDPAKVFEDEFKWDASEAEIVNFWGNWRVNLKKDERTSAWFNIKMQGKQNVKDKFGSVTIKLKASLTSKWKFNSAIDKAMGYYYLNYVYADQRRRYLEEVKRDMEKFENLLRKRLEVSEMEKHV